MNNNQALFDEDWIRRYFLEVDRMSPRDLVNWYEPNGTFRFANNSPVSGHASIVEILKQFYSLIDAMHHRETGLWIDNNSGVFEAEVTFTKKDKTQITIPAASILRIRNGRVHDFRMIMDASPVLL